MAATTIGILPFLLFFGGFSLPLGLPPLPEDPAISRVAPAECLAYVSWAGTAAPDPKSTNQMEQLLAEPEVQRLVSAVDSAISTGVKKRAQHDANWAAVGGDVYPLAKTLLTHPAAIFLSTLEVNPQGPPNVQGGAVFNLAEKTTSASETLDRLEKLLPPGIVENVEIGGVSFHRIKPSPVVTLTWGVRNKYLIVGVGENSVEDILKRAKADPPAWLAAIRKQLPVNRQSSLIYFNVKQAVTQFAPMGGPKVVHVLGAIGLKNVSCLASVTGLDDKGTIARTLVAIDGQPQGIFRLATAKPLASADLAPIPRDATIAAAGRLDASAALELLLTQVEKIDPSARAGAVQAIGQMGRELGIDVQDDLLKSLGDVWCVYNSPSEGGLLVTGMTGVVQVKDHDRLQSTLDTLVALFHDRVERPAAGPGNEAQAYAQRRTPRIVKTAFAGHVFYHFDIPEHEFPLAPAWCLTDKELIVSTFPQNIKSYLSRDKGFRSLATAPEVAEALGREDVVALNYCDTRKMAEFAYPLLCVGSRLLSSELNRQGVPLDSSLLPSAAAVFPHLHASVGTVRRTAGGIEVESRGPLAGVGGGSLLPASFAMLFAVRTGTMQPARAEAFHAQSLNNLRMIGLAMHNYLSVHGTFPPAYTCDKATGKPLLSWRVAILPYIGEDALYHEFHLDEAWDSAHNKGLVGRMPNAYRSPGSTTPQGTTKCVTLRHKDSVFPGKDGVKMADITDGSSNTIMAVEADDAHAVIWTKPDDLKFDPEKPTTGLTGQPSGGFNVLFCDGSVRVLSDAVDTETVRNLVNCHDGNPVSIP